MSRFTKKKKNAFSSNNTSFRQLRLFGFLSLFAILLTAFSLLLLRTDLVSDWENRFQTHFYQLRSSFAQPVAVDLPLVVVLIDDHSLPVGSSRSPIDREWLAGLVEQISGHNPELIGLNVLLDRTGDKRADQDLTDALRQAGNVILRDDPFYPVFPTFKKAALDSGTASFRLDSSDTVQEVCNSKTTCKSGDIFHRKILDYYHFVAGNRKNRSLPEEEWLKINFSAGSEKSGEKRLLSFPVIRAHEVKDYPAKAFKDKIVLVGTGFPDLYPLYRVPLPNQEMMLQETELIAQVISMIAGDRTFSSPAWYWTGGILFLVLALTAAVLIFKGSLMGLLVAFFAVIALFTVSGWSFAFHNYEIPFVLPSTVILIFSVAAMLVETIQQRFFRLEAEVMLKQAKIDFLTNELHSHHLFNEFSRLSVMIRQDPASAREYLVEFAEMLRSSLLYGDKTLVAVEQQVEYLQSYIKQQQIIHKDKMTFSVTIEEGLGELMIPWHAFFPLVENAVKYAEAYLQKTRQKQIEIGIELKAEESMLSFRVSNPYDETLDVISAKKGLANLKERLSWAYPKGGYELDFARENGTWTAHLELPVGA